MLVTHSATAMSLCASLIGLDLWVPALGPLANCHWSELWCESEGGVVAPSRRPASVSAVAAAGPQRRRARAGDPGRGRVSAEPVDEAPDAEA